MRSRPRRVGFETRPPRDALARLLVFTKTAVIVVPLLLSLASCVSPGGMWPFAGPEAAASTGTQVPLAPTRSSSGSFPQPAPEASFTAAEAAYMVTIMQMTDVLIVSLDPYNTLMGDPKLEDEAWTDSVRQELIKWKTTYQQAQHMSVPSERFKAIHQKYLAALAQFDAAADDTAFGIVVGDPESLVEANDRLRSAAVLMKEIGAMIRTMKG